jgi:hypothetical protein
MAITAEVHLLQRYLLVKTLVLFLEVRGKVLLLPPGPLLEGAVVQQVLQQEQQLLEQQA